MYKLAVLLAISIALTPAGEPQNSAQSECIQRCILQPRDPEMERQEIVNLEKEAATAIQHGDGTFFRRVYSDDFSGTLSHGEQVNKAQFVEAVQSAAVQYESFHASDIIVHIYRETAVATCLWSSRAGERPELGQPDARHARVRERRKRVESGGGRSERAAAVHAVGAVILRPLANERMLQNASKFSGSCDYAEVARSTLSATTIIPISSFDRITSTRLPCNGLLLTISWTKRSSMDASMNFAFARVMWSWPGPSMQMLVGVAAVRAR